MRAGLRDFLHPGGAESLDVEDILKISDRCLEVLKVKKVPMGKTVHLYSKSWTSSQVACKALWLADTTEENSTEVLAYVSCGSCKKTNLFRKANGEDVKEKRVILHFETTVKDPYSWYQKGTITGAACGNWYKSNMRTARFHDVTCQTCTKTKAYKVAEKRSATAKKAATTRNKNKEKKKALTNAVTSSQGVK